MSGSKSGVGMALGLAGAVIGAVAAGAAAGVAAERFAVTRRQRRGGDDPYVDEPFGNLPADATIAVETEDGVELYVEIVEPDGPADLTVIFSHGFCLDMGTWHFQRAALTKGLDQRAALTKGLDQRRALTKGLGQGHGLATVSGEIEEAANAGLDESQADEGRAKARGLGRWRKHAEPAKAKVRMVFYDQPGHGSSGRRPSGDYTIDQLGADLAAVIEQVAPEGPLVLVGHSMGGMTVMALAEQFPDLIAERVAGVGLFSTSAGHLDDVALGLPPVVARFRGSLTPIAARALKWQPTIAEYGRRAGSDLAYLLTKRYGFGTGNPSPTLVHYVEKMNASTPVEVIAGYLGTLSEHDRYAALEAFVGIEMVVVCGDKDLITPVEHTREIARLLPHAALLEVEGGGHCTLMEFHDEVNEAFLAMLGRAAWSARERRTAQERAAKGKRPKEGQRKQRRGDEMSARVERRAKAEAAGGEERRALQRILRRKGA